MLPTGHREPSTSPAGPVIGHSGPIFSPPAPPSQLPFSLLPALTEDICMSAASPATASSPPAPAALSPPEAVNTYAKASILICV